ncbi:MAG: ATP-binding protein [Candidatus Krumholzibacteriota bacterium]|nr:ATP-binding protein [Candidatus Krumholzibacteriota bacterium]
MIVKKKNPESKLKELTAKVEKLQKINRELNKSNKKFKELYEKLPLPYQCLAEDGIIRNVNPAWLDTLGYRIEEVIGKNFTGFLHPDWKTRFEKKFLNLKKCGYRSNVQLKIRNKKGVYLDISFDGHVVYQHEGGFKQAYCVFKDITKPGKMEEDVCPDNIELERRVKKLTEDLMSSNSDLKTFIYSASHDLRSPVHVIDGFSQILLEDYGDNMDEDGRHYLKRVRAATGRLNQTMNDMLKLSRAGRRKMVLEEVYLGNIAKEIAAEMRAADSSRRVEIEIQDGMIAMGDTYLLRLVIKNLFKNAWKFTKQKEKAKIRFGEKEHGGNKIYFIEDNGAGFDMRYSHKLFRSFESLHSRDDFQGTGIGLTMVKDIILRHEGHVWGESEGKGKGAVFSFTLKHDKN